MADKTKEKVITTQTENLGGIFVIYEVEETESGPIKDRLLGFGKKKAQAIIKHIEEIKKFAE